MKNEADRRHQVQPLGSFDLGRRTKVKTSASPSPKASQRERPLDRTKSDKQNPINTQGNEEHVVWAMAAFIGLGCGYWFITYLI